VDDAGPAADGPIEPGRDAHGSPLAGRVHGAHGQEADTGRDADQPAARRDGAGHRGAVEMRVLAATERIEAGRDRAGKSRMGRRAISLRPRMRGARSTTTSLLTYRVSPGGGGKNPTRAGACCAAARAGMIGPAGPPAMFPIGVTGVIGVVPITPRPGSRPGPRGRRGGGLSPGFPSPPPTRDPGSRGFVELASGGPRLPVTETDRCWRLVRPRSR